MKNVHVSVVGAYRDAQGKLTLMALCRTAEKAQLYTVTLPGGDWHAASVRLCHRDPFARNSRVQRRVVLEALPAEDIAVTSRTLTFTASSITLLENFYARTINKQESRAVSL